MRSSVSPTKDPIDHIQNLDNQQQIPGRSLQRTRGTFSVSPSDYQIGRPVKSFRRTRNNPDPATLQRAATKKEAREEWKNASRYRPAAVLDLLSRTL